MTDSIERQQRIIREGAAELAAMGKPKRSLRQRITDLLAREPHPKPHRISGPTLVPKNWHEAKPNALLPLAGPRCQGCRASMLPGSGLLSDRNGWCGECQDHGRAIGRAPQVEDDGPNQAA